MLSNLPPGWPAEVLPPGSDAFTDSAVKWLFEAVPPHYREHDVLRRHPAALAQLARHHTQAAVAGARHGYRTLRSDLGGHLLPHVIDSVLSAYKVEGKRLAASARAAELLERALQNNQDQQPYLPNDRGILSDRPASVIKSREEVKQVSPAREGRAAFESAQGSKAAGIMATSCDLLVTIADVREPAGGVARR